MIELFYIFYLLLIIIQIFTIIKIRKKDTNTYWNLFMGITLSNYISIGMHYVFCDLDDTLDVGGAIMVVFMSGVLSVINTILLIIGIIVKKKTKNESKFNKKFFITGIICIAITAIIMIVVPLSTMAISKNIASKKAIEYLNNKYGDGDYKVESVEYDFSYNGIVQKYHTGYEVNVLSNKLNKKMMVVLDRKFNNPYAREEYDLNE